MDFSIDVSDWMAASPKHIFASLKEGDRAAVMPDTGAVSSGSSPFCNIGKRLTDAVRTLTRVCAWAGRRAWERLCSAPGLLLTTEVSFSCHCQPSFK